MVTRHIVDMAQAFNRFYHDEHILVDNEEEKISTVSYTHLDVYKRQDIRHNREHGFCPQRRKSYYETAASDTV